MTITATFSNGYTDTYKGKREVTAAWAIIRKADGKVMMSGHSMDTAKALKTGTGNIRTYFAHGQHVDKPNNHMAAIIVFNKIAREHGFRNWKDWYAADQLVRDEQAKGFTVEVISI